MCSFCSQAAFQSENYSAEIIRPAEAGGANLVAATGNNNIDGLLSGFKWTTNALTWRIPASASQYDTNSTVAGIQYDDIDRVNGWLAPTATMTTAATFIFNKMFAGVSGLTFTAVAGSNTNADLTIGRATAVTGDFETAYAYYPTGPGSGLSGDSWFSNSYDSDGAAFKLDAPKLGGYNWATYIHEFGHNMGLKHGQDLGGVRNISMDGDRDSMEFSVMTYRSYVGASPTGGYTNESYGFAQTLMMYDIAALQVMYGANFNENSSNSVYTFSTTTGEMSINGVGQGTPGANRIFRTVWDGNGIDTYDLSNYTTNLAIDLTPGGWSVFSTGQIANLGNNNFARGNLFNALQFNGDVRSLIENAIGGSGDDKITGNAANNTLTGGGGADIISGGIGLDTIYGGAGNDRISGGTGRDWIDGGSGNDTAVFEVSQSSLKLVRFGDVVQVFSTNSAEKDWTQAVETFEFNNGSVGLNSLQSNDVYSYMAGNVDLIRAFRNNIPSAVDHYFQYGYSEGRQLDSFDEWSYLAGNRDLMNAFGSNGAAATKHYVDYGFGEGRQLSAFEAWSYLASNLSLLPTLGLNIDNATRHFVNTGYRQGLAEDTFNDDLYLASNTDVLAALGNNEDTATYHYLRYGINEGRKFDFNAAQYLNNYADLKLAFGNNLDLAVAHFVEYGFYEGRTDDWLGV